MLRPDPKTKAAFLVTLDTLQTLIQKARADLCAYDFDRETLAAAVKTIDGDWGFSSLRARVDALYAWINHRYDAVLMEEYDRKEEEDI